MRKYLEALITEKGRELDDAITIPGHYGLTWEVLIDYIENNATDHHAEIKKMLVMIDFKNGDVFHYLTHLATGMIKAMGYDV